MRRPGRALADASTMTVSYAPRPGEDSLKRPVDSKSAGVGGTGPTASKERFSTSVRRMCPWICSSLVKHLVRPNLRFRTLNEGAAQIRVDQQEPGAAAGPNSGPRKRRGRLAFRGRVLVHEHGPGAPAVVVKRRPARTAE